MMMLYVSHFVKNIIIIIIINNNHHYHNNNNSSLVAWGIWLLAGLRTTNLKSVKFQCPLVGHTHGSLDRIFNRLIVSLRGQTYMTLTELDDVFSQGLKGFAIKWNHHESSYDWTYVRTVYGMEFQPHSNVNALRLDLDRGTWVKWKQYMLTITTTIEIVAIVTIVTTMCHHYLSIIAGGSTYSPWVIICNNHY